MSADRRDVLKGLAALFSAPFAVRAAPKLVGPPAPVEPEVEEFDDDFDDYDDFDLDEDDLNLYGSGRGDGITPHQDTIDCRFIDEIDIPKDARVTLNIVDSSMPVATADGFEHYIRTGLQRCYVHVETDDMEFARRAEHALIANTEHDLVSAIADGGLRVRGRFSRIDHQFGPEGRTCKVEFVGRVVS